jgi:hypothetical protein
MLSRALETAEREQYDLPADIFREVPEYLRSVMRDPNEHTRARMTAAKGLNLCAAHNLSARRQILEHEKPEAPNQLHLHQHGPGRDTVAELRAMREQLEALTGPEETPPGETPPDSPPEAK